MYFEIILGYGGLKVDWIKIHTLQSDVNFMPGHDKFDTTRWAIGADYIPGKTITCNFPGYLDGWNRYLGQNCTLE